MPFRDDQDALLARADALQTDLEKAQSEADALREKNAALDREVAELRAAAKAPEAPETPAASAARAHEPAPAPKVRRSQPARRGDRLDQALAGLSDDTLMQGLLWIGLPIVLVLVAIVREPWIAIPAVVLGLVVGALSSWYRRRARVAWIRTLPFALDRDSFAKRIAAEPQQAPIRVRVRFAAAPPESVRASMTGEWDGDDLIVTTPPIASSKRIQPRTVDPYSIFVPAPYLLACRQVADDLIRIHSSTEIAEIVFEDPRPRRDRE